MSDAGVPIEKIAQLVGHTGTATTELVYRKQIRPVVTGARRSWTNCSPHRALMLSYSVGYSGLRGYGFRTVVMAFYLRGRGRT